MKKKNLDLRIRWGKRLQLWKEGNNLKTKAQGFWIKSNEVWAEGDKAGIEGDITRSISNGLRAKGDMFWAKGNELWAKGNGIWARAILKKYGNIELDWVWNEKTQNYDCKLETGETYKC